MVHLFDGSSPRLRGTEGLADRLALTRRFIPAPAGNRRVRVWGIVALSVHPRACGEQKNTSRAPKAWVGSSPRLRGTVKPVARPARPGRFIPAPAGNSSSTSTPCGWRPVHPRACGEQGMDSRRRFQRSAVHPRACGEQFVFPSIHSRTIGSSPRLRGTAQQPDWSTSRLPVHPRACGEQRREMTQQKRLIGSSPRLRGTDEFKAMDFGSALRFIPAPAGNRLVFMSLI